VGAAGAPVGTRFEVSGVVQAAAGGLDVTVTLKNVGDGGAGPVVVEGELGGRRQTGTLDEGVPPGASGSLLLHYPNDLPRPGVHALTLLLDYSEAAPGADGTTPSVSQRAFLLLALGANPEPAVRAEAPEVRLETRSNLIVGLESEDGAPHRVRL
jgi:hypothetical protein